MVAAAGFIHGRSETIGANTGTSVGTTVTASGSTNVLGSWALIGQTTFGWDWLNIYMAQTAASDKIVEIGIADNNGGTGVYTIAEGLRFQGRKSADLILSLALPLRVRSGAYVYARIAASTASHILQVVITGSSVGMKGGNGYSRAIGLYPMTNSRGVSIDAGGTANTKSGWTQLTASSNASVDSIYVMIGQNADTTRTAVATALLDIGVGSSGNEFAMIPNILLRWSTALDGPQISIGPLPCYIPNGTRVVAQMQCTDTATGDRTADVAVIGFVP